MASPRVLRIRLNPVNPPEMWREPRLADDAGRLPGVVETSRSTTRRATRGVCLGTPRVFKDGRANAGRHGGEGTGSAMLPQPWTPPDPGAATVGRPSTAGTRPFWRRAVAPRKPRAHFEPLAVEFPRSFLARGGSISSTREYAPPMNICRAVVVTNQPDGRSAFSATSGQQGSVVERKGSCSHTSGGLRATRAGLEGRRERQARAPGARGRLIAFCWRGIASRCRRGVFSYTSACGRGASGHAGKSSYSISCGI